MPQFDQESEDLINNLIPRNRQGQIRNIEYNSMQGYLGMYENQPVYHRDEEHSQYGMPFWTILANGDIHLFGFYNEKGRKSYKLREHCGTKNTPKWFRF